MMPLKPAGGVSQMNSPGRAGSYCCAKAAHSCWLKRKNVNKRKLSFKCKLHPNSAGARFVVLSSHFSLLRQTKLKSCTRFLYVVGMQTYFNWWALICAYLSFLRQVGGESWRSGRVSYPLMDSIFSTSLWEEKRHTAPGFYIHTCLNSLLLPVMDYTLEISFSCPQMTLILCLLYLEDCWILGRALFRGGEKSPWKTIYPLPSTAAL